MKLGGGAVHKDLRLAKALRRFEGAIVVEGGKFSAESMLNFAIISTARAMVTVCSRMALASMCSCQELLFLNVAAFHTQSITL